MDARAHGVTATPTRHWQRSCSPPIYFNKLQSFSRESLRLWRSLLRALRCAARLAALRGGGRHPWPGSLLPQGRCGLETSSPQPQFVPTCEESRRGSDRGRWSPLPPAPSPRCAKAAAAPFPPPLCSQRGLGAAGAIPALALLAFGCRGNRRRWRLERCLSGRQAGRWGGSGAGIPLGSGPCPFLPAPALLCCGRGRTSNRRTGREGHWAVRSSVSRGGLGAGAERSRTRRCRQPGSSRRRTACSGRVVV